MIIPMAITAMMVKVWMTTEFVTKVKAKDWQMPLTTLRTSSNNMRS